MAEYIEREELISELDELISNISFSSPYQDEIDRMIVGMERARDCVENAETADVAPVVHAKWEPVTEGAWNLQTPICIGWSCPLCGRYEQYKEPYCNCGARMDGE